MNISEEKLLRSGFTGAELQKLRRYLVKNELTLDMVINDLSKRFQAAFWLTVGILVVYTVTLFLASKENIISLGIALLVALLITWFFQPPVLAYKSWAFRRKMLNG
ncbi:hypothetical protein [Erwinia oleae]|uniref:hypothetical protein n=1 Tax=Erwinia oleae TaxID=796334 RepID=UPI000551235C|nr:hypothetical protein [Erwinia oleae]